MWFAVAHFARQREYAGIMPPDMPEDALLPTIEWYGKDYDGGRNQLTLGFDNVVVVTDIDGEKVWSALSATASEAGFKLVSNPKRSSNDTFFFDLKGGGNFEPQSFINRFTSRFYAN